MRKEILRMRIQYILASADSCAGRRIILETQITYVGTNLVTNFKLRIGT